MNRKANNSSRIGRLTFMAVALAGVLSGCAGDLMPYGSSVRNLMPEEAVVMPPPGGPAIVSVLEHQYSNAIDQRILLATKARTPGQNYINATFFGTRNYSPMNGERLSYSSVTDRDVAEEMRAEIPGVAMKLSPYYVQNNYGPFGYAFGEGRGSDLCMYGWQQIRPDRGGLAAFGQTGTIQIRVRFCESGASEDDLLGIMYGYTINAAIEAYGWNPYGEPNAPPPLLGKSGAPTYATRAHDDRPEKISNTTNILGGGGASAPAPQRRATTSQTSSSTSSDMVNLEVVDLPTTAMQLPVGPTAAQSSMAPPTGPSSVAPPASTAPPARSIPAPGRQTSANTTPTGNAAASGSRSIPAPPCRLLPGSTTVTCE